MNFGTKLRTLLVVASCFNTALMATDVAQFNNSTVDFIYTVLSVAANFVIVFCATYFNNDYSEEACEATGEMRAKKAEKKGINGEYFYEEGEQIDEPEDL